MFKQNQKRLNKIVFFQQKFSKPKKGQGFRPEKNSV